MTVQRNLILNIGKEAVSFVGITSSSYIFGDVATRVSNTLFKTPKGAKASIASNPTKMGVYACSESVLSSYNNSYITPLLGKINTKFFQFSGSNLETKKVGEIAFLFAGLAISSSIKGVASRISIAALSIIQPGAPVLICALTALAVSTAVTLIIKKLTSKPEEAPEEKVNKEPVPQEEPPTYTPTRIDNLVNSTCPKLTSGIAIASISCLSAQFINLVRAGTIANPVQTAATIGLTSAALITASKIANLSCPQRLSGLQGRIEQAKLSAQKIGKRASVLMPSSSHLLLNAPMIILAPSRLITLAALGSLAILCKASLEEPDNYPIAVRTISFFTGESLSEVQKKITLPEEKEAHQAELSDPQPEDLT